MRGTERRGENRASRRRNNGIPAVFIKLVSLSAIVTNDKCFNNGARTSRGTEVGKLNQISIRMLFHHKIR